MKPRTLLWCAALTSLAAAGWSQPAFPGAEGFGASATGGAGGREIWVTTLDPSGPGSLREAVDAEGPRIVKFQVSGTIELRERRLVIAERKGKKICYRAADDRIAQVIGLAARTRKRIETS